MTDRNGLLLTLARPGTGEQLIGDAWVFPLDGSEPRKTDLAGSSLGLFGIAIHPDGRKVAFSSSSPERMTDIWVLESFLPKAAAKTGLK